MSKNNRNVRKTPVMKRLHRLNEGIGEPVMKLFKDLEYGELFSTVKGGKLIRYNDEISGCSSISSPTRMCYFMAGYKDETRVDGDKDDLLNMPVYSYGFPEGYEAPAADDVHDDELVDLAQSTTYRDSIIDCANRCRKASNRKLILSLLDDPDVIFEDGLETRGKSTKKSRTKKVNEGYDMSDGYPVMGNDEVNKIYKFIMGDAWIGGMILHYDDVKDDKKDDDHKEMVPLVIKDICRHTGLNHEHIRVVFGYYQFVVDIDMVYNEIPAYIHIVREAETGKWSVKVFRRGH